MILQNNRRKIILVWSPNIQDGLFKLLAACLRRQGQYIPNLPKRQGIADAIGTEQQRVLCLEKERDTGLIALHILFAYVFGERACLNVYKRFFHGESAIYSP